MESYVSFSQKVKEKYPQYAEVDDLKLAKAMVKKYPQYADKVSFDEIIPEQIVDEQPQQLEQKPQDRYSILESKLGGSFNPNDPRHKKAMRILANKGRVATDESEWTTALTGDVPKDFLQENPESFAKLVNWVGENPTKSGSIIGQLDEGKSDASASLLSTGGDVLSAPGRAFGALVESGVSKLPSWLGGAGEGESEISYQESLTDDPRIQRGFFGQLAKDVVSDPATGATALTMGLAGPTLSGLKGAQKIGAMSGIGAGEGVISEGARKTREGENVTLGDLATAGGVGMSAGLLPEVAIPWLKKGARALFETGKEAVSKTAGLVGPRTEGAVRGMLDAQAPLGTRIVGKKVVDDRSDLVDYAKSLGLREDQIPTAISKGKNSSVFRNEQSIMQGPSGKKLIDRHNNAIDVVENKIDDLSGGGSYYDPETTGLSINDGVMNAKNAVFNKSKTTYQTIVDNAEQSHAVNNLIRTDKAIFKDLSTELSDLQGNMLDRYNRALNPKKKKALGDALETIQNINDKLLIDFENPNANLLQTINDVRSQMGELAYSKDLNKLDILSDELDVIRKSEQSARKAMQKAVDKASPELGLQLRESNELLSEFFNNANVIKSFAGMESKPSKVVFAQSFLNVENARALKNVLRESGQEGVFDNAFNSWLNNKVLVRGVNGDIVPSAIKNIKNNRAMIKEFKGEEFYNELINAIKFKNELGNKFMPGSAGQVEFSKTITGAPGRMLQKATLGAQSVSDEALEKPFSTKLKSIPLRNLIRGQFQEDEK